MKKIPFSKLSSGFTLAEVVLAVGLITLFMLAIIGLLGPANKSVVRVLAIDKISRSYSAVENYLNSTSNNEHEAVRFARIYNTIQPKPAAGETIAAPENELFVIFTYRAATGITAAGDGEAVAPSDPAPLEPAYDLPRLFAPPTDGSIPRQGIDYVLYDAVLPLPDFIDFVPNNSDQRPGFLEGQVFVAALVESDVNPAENSITSYKVENPDTNGDGVPDVTNSAYFGDPDDPDDAGDTYPEAVVVADVQFFLVNRVSDDGLRAALGIKGATAADDRPAEPILTLPIGINR